MATAATIDNPRSWLDGLKDAWLTCRELNHVWRVQGDEWTRAADGPGWVRTLKCANCRAERTDRVDRYGEVVQRRYDYPQGYQAKGIRSWGGLGKTAFRREVMRRAGLDQVVKPGPFERVEGS